MKTIKLATWNVNGIRASYEKGLSAFIKTVQPDILCLQETKAHKEQVNQDLQNLGYKFNYWSSAERKGYSGVATFLNDEPQKVLTTLDNPDYEKEGRVIWSQHEEFDLYNIYFPNGGSGEERHFFKQKFLKELLSHLKFEMKKGKQIVVVGDYNVAFQEVDVHDPVRLSKESGFLPEERAWFEQFFKAGFIDCYRHLHGDKKEIYSWWSYRELSRARNKGWRIDYICMTQGLRQNLKVCDVLMKQEGSDHCPVLAEFQF
jgi:exodeoxyribonuclease III